MSNFAQDILNKTNGEMIEGIVIGEMGWVDYNDKGKPEYKKSIGKLLSWEEAIPILDYEYNNGFGAPDCQAITAWTKNRVIFVSEYDGSTTICHIPRNPVAHMPDMMPGGG